MVSEIFPGNNNFYDFDKEQCDCCSMSAFKLPVLAFALFHDYTLLLFVNSSGPLLDYVNRFPKLGLAQEKTTGTWFNMTVIFAGCREKFGQYKRWVRLPVIDIRSFV